MNERSIFLEALDKDDPTQRLAYLDTACAGDDALRQRVEALLESHAAAGNVLDKLAPERIAEELARQQTDGETQDGTPGTPEEDVGGDELGFLTPADKPGVLGRLAHHEVLEVIGKGGMGIVLRAFDEKLHRVVAIKVMAAQLATNASARRRFTREAQAQAAVSHDHIVTIHAVEGDSPQPYLIMQYVAGFSLQQRLDRDGPLALQEILRIGMQTASGLAAAHAQGLVHRDVKPANILLENGVERVKITDFGLARAANEASLTQSGVVTGTPQYMSPEQAEGNAIDQRSDLFSLGSVVYAMCTGRAPFRASGTMAVLKRVCEETPRPIREVNPDIPDWLVAIIDKLHAKQPAERYQSAGEVAELLGRHLAHLQHPSVMSLPPEVAGAESSQPRPVPLTDPAKTQGGLGRRWAIAAAVLLCLVGGLSVTEATGVTNLYATVIRIFTRDGTLVVQVNDPGVKVSIEGDGGLVITGAGPQEVRLRPGSYKVQAAKDGKPVHLDQELVTITRGGRRVVRVAVEAKGSAEPARPTFITPWSDSDDWVVKGEELHQLDDNATAWHCLFFGDPSWTDYDFEAEAQITGGDSELELVFRVTDYEHRFNAMVGGFRNTRHGLMAVSPGGAGTIALALGKTEKGRWYRLRVEARGNKFKMFLDGKRVVSGYSDQYPRGRVGLATNGVSARFRNLKVTDPDGKVLLQGVQNVLPRAKGAGKSRPPFVTPWSDSDDWVVKGQEVHQLDDSASAGHVLFFGDPSWTDYDFEAEAEALTGEAALGLMFRATRPGRRLDAGIGGFGNTQNVLVRIEEGKGPFAFSLKPGRSENGRWYKLRVEVRAHKIKFFVDGKRLLSSYAEDYPRGCVGLLTNGSSARFRNLKVTAPDGKVLFEGVQGLLPKLKGARALGGKG